MQIDELPAGEQNQCPDMDMNRVVGTHDILMLCFDTLRYDVSKAEEAAGGTPVLNSHGGLWEKRHAPVFVNGNCPFSCRIILDTSYISPCGEIYIVSHIKKTVDFYSVVLKQITYFVGSVVLGFPTF